MDHALNHFQARKLAILHDDFSNLGRCLIVSPAKDLTSELLNELVSLSFGILKVTLEQEKIEQLMLKPMLKNESPEQIRNKTISNFVSIDAREGITTGISIEDRLKAVACLTSSTPDPKSLVSPGHLIPIQVAKGGLIVRNALYEGAHDLVKITSLGGSAVLADLLAVNGCHLSETARLELAHDNDIPLINLSELTKELLRKNKLVECTAKAKMPSKLCGELTAYMYEVHNQAGEHLALVKGQIKADQITCVKVHVASAFEDIFGSGKFSSRDKITESLHLMENEPAAIFLYLRLEKTAPEKSSQQTNYGMRNYGIGAQILHDLGARKLKLITQNTANLEGLQAFGLEIVETINPSQNKPAKLEKFSL